MSFIRRNDYYGFLLRVLKVSALRNYEWTTVLASMFARPDTLKISLKKKISTSTTGVLNFMYYYLCVTKFQAVDLDRPRNNNSHRTRPSIPFFEYVSPVAAHITESYRLSLIDPKTI